jgi:hypothetical protein
LKRYILLKKIKKKKKKRTWANLRKLQFCERSVRFQLEEILEEVKLK